SKFFVVLSLLKLKLDYISLAEVYKNRFLAKTKVLPPVCSQDFSHPFPIRQEKTQVLTTNFLYIF
ncbi:hypothetical protein, partial [Microcoleus sp. herbarium5]|uniref:hypothetical protein n=1 Tax=Microcoleus sp. herbarium5 TaxID=3055434 RepID=UPI002FD4E1E8